MNANLTTHRVAKRLAFATLLFASCASQAVVISYTATDLTDVNPGEDLWAYKYQVTGATFASGEGFSVFSTPHFTAASK